MKQASRSDLSFGPIGPIDTSDLDSGRTP